MTLSYDIKAAYEHHRDAIDELNAVHEGQVGIHMAHIKAGQRRCSHPSKYETSCMGERGVRCPDCGWTS